METQSMMKGLLATNSVEGLLEFANRISHFSNENGSLSNPSAVLSPKLETQIDGSCHEKCGKTIFQKIFTYWEKNLHGKMNLGVHVLSHKTDIQEGMKEEGQPLMKVDEFRHKKELVCKACGKTFQAIQSLDSHLKCHIAGQPFACYICPSKFRTKQILFRHLNAQHGEKPYPCFFCFKSFGNKQSLGVHTRTHTGERHFSCSICKKSFSSLCHFNGHVKCHNKAKNFLCEICGKCFGTARYFKRHIKTHTLSYQVVLTPNSGEVSSVEHTVLINGAEPETSNACPNK